MTIFNRREPPVNTPTKPSTRTPLPQEVAIAPPPPPPSAYVPKRRSAAAEAAAEQWDQLESDLNHYRDCMVRAEAELEATRLQLIAAQKALEACRLENDRLIRESTAIHTKVNLAASVILSIRGDDTRLDRAVAEASAAIEEALATPKPTEPTQ